MNVSRLEIQAKTVEELFRNIELQSELIASKELKRAITFVNDINIFNLNRYKTKLKNGDEVIILSPVAGG